MNRVLLEYEGLKSYFLSENCRDARFQRLRRSFENPMTEIFFMFFQASLPTFTQANKLLQREEPCIHILFDRMLELVRSFLKRFISPRVIRRATDITDSSVRASKDQLSDEELVGYATNQMLRRLEREGDITSLQQKNFLAGVRKFFSAATEYLTSRFPFEDALFQHAKWTDFRTRQSAKFASVLYFVEKYNGVINFSHTEIDSLQSEFLDYQMLSDSFLPEDVGKDGFKLDSIWAFLARAKHADGQEWFSLLSKVARLVATIPHSNAGEERTFSMIRKNRSESRPWLNAETTVASIIITKLAMTQGTVLKFEPTKELLLKAKTATARYNRKRRNDS